MGRRRGWGLVLAAVSAGLAGVGGLAMNAATANPPVWPNWLSWVPLPPLATAVALLSASVVVAVVGVAWAIPRRGWGLLISAVLAGTVALVASVASVAINAATAIPPAWPGWLDWMPLPPVTATFLLIGSSTVLAGAVVWWDRRPEPVTLRGLFTTPDTVSPPSLLRADQAVVRFRGDDRERLFKELTIWSTNGPRLATRLVIDGGGQGRTRLAGQVAAEGRQAPHGPGPAGRELAPGRYRHSQQASGADLGSDRYAPILATHMHALAALLQAGHPVDAREGEPAEEGAPAARAPALGRHRRYR